MRKTFIAVLFLSLGFAASLFASVTLAETKKPHFKIGVILGLTGPLTSWCEASQNAAELAKELLPDELKATTNLVFEDDGFDPKKTVAAFHKLMTVDKVDAIISWASGNSKAIAPLAEQRKIPLIAIAASDPSLPKNRSFVFTMWTTPDSETAALLPYLRKRKMKHLVRVVTIQEGTLAMRESFDVLSKGEYHMVYDEQVDGAERDFRSILSRIRAKGEFDAFWMVLIPPQSGIFSRQARELGFTQPFFSYEMLEDVKEIQASRGALEGAIFATGAAGDRGFIDEFKKRYPNSATVTAAQTFDAVTLLAKGLRSGDATGFLRSLKDYQGASGIFSATGDGRFTLPATLKMVKGQDFVQVSE